MRSTFLQEYERKLVESAVDSRNRDIAAILKDNNVSRDIILKATGVDVEES